ncbi:fatty-acyl-CoA synthase [Kribbella sp. VKM Ac-2571]|uniref:AMP-binding protein n=1 Tax=Kribbella sp. VKM Ac-2571 TaxID=2512222 RepID=UPI0010D1D6A8|nr:AMP-binding protein [Kribbella sp. VKM Ac-2571]TDO52070.1 fatty-acyl-CoA synthase [Kribbella sp. VKM Ac-2571]
MRTIRPIRPLRPPEWLVQSAAEVGGLSVALIRSGVWRSAGPTQLVRIERALRTWGQSMAALGVIAAIRYPERPAVISGDDEITYAELDRRCERIAAGMRAQYGIVAGSKVAVLCRNHRGFLEATLAASRIGADVLFVNTEFAPPQLRAVLERHRLDLLVHDSEFTPPNDIPAVLSSLDELARSVAPAAPPPETAGHITTLTSGTTGTPKAAPRVPTALGLAGLTGSALSRFGLRAGEPMVVCPPLFHGLGLLTSTLALFLGSPLVLRPRFDAATVLADVEATRAGAIVAVPVMLRRMLDLGPNATAEYDLRSLRAVISGASQLGAPLAERFIERFGPVLCDAYGSSEVGIATIATSADLLAAPGTVGRPCLGSTIRILDDQDRTVPIGTTGRIFAGGGLVFGGYSDGSSKTVVDGRMSTGDLGHVDAAGRLFVDGREDDMIVSGGENVYPVEVEQCLAAHPAVAEAVVAGVPDDEFGQRLIAYVVLHSPATEDELLTHVKANLARYKTPRQIVVLDEFPRNATGKVLRGKLTPP